jgi:uncharacterized repeat protein (TIGR03803 family)
VFEFAKDGTERVLHAFKGGHDGSGPWGPLVEDAEGNLIGTTVAGGKVGYGTVFKLAPDGTETILRTFRGRNGAAPFSGVIMDEENNLYGTAGVVYELTADGRDCILHSNNGSDPVGGLVADKDGNLYGTTEYGGLYGRGTIFKIAKNGTQTIIHSFAGGADGENPLAGLTEDAAGNFYGTTMEGGTYLWGTIYKLTRDGTESILYSFTGKSDGAWPSTVPVVDHAGNLYGTASTGGNSTGGARCGGRYSCGTVFRLSNGALTIFHTFDGAADGGGPNGSLVADSAGNLYGTTVGGGRRGPDCKPIGCGTIYMIANAIPVQ